jgi:hypothetical protein
MIFDVIDTIMTWQERHTRSRQLAASHDYDAVIIYDKKNGIAKEVVFERRGG